MNLLHRLASWLLSLPGSLKGFIDGLLDRPYKIAVVKALPAKPAKGILYVIEEDGYQEQAAMVCPCGCGQTLHMNLLEDARPCWEVTIHADNTPSLHPSVWRKVGCKSHFWLKNGRVLFV